MSAPRLDPETLASYLDGRLTPAERERVLEILAESPADYEAMLATAEVMRQVGRDLVVSLPEPRSRFNRRWLLVASATVLVTIIASMVSRRVYRADAGPPRLLAAALDLAPGMGPGSLARRLGPDWVEPAWPVTRGGSPTLPDRATSFRVGARLVDLEVAIHAEDPAPLGRLDEDLARLAGQVSGGGAVAFRFGALRNAQRDPADPERIRAAAAARSLVGASPWFDVGAWVEAARLALLVDRVEFFAPAGPAAGLLPGVISGLAGAPAEPAKAASAAALRAIETLSHRTDPSPTAAEYRVLVDTVQAEGAR